MLKDEDGPLAERAYSELMTIKDHEEAHVKALRTTISDLGGEPIEEPSFDFGLAVQYPMAFLSTAQQLEDVGISAYAGAAPSIESEDVLPAALVIHSVEARHASFLRTLNNETSYPNVVDEPRTKSEVLEIAGQFIIAPSEEPAEDGTGTETS